MIQKQHESKLEVGQTFPVTIKRLGINGEGVGYFKRQVVFIPGHYQEKKLLQKQRKFSVASLKRK